MSTEKIILWDIKKTSEFLNRTPGALRNMVLRRTIPYRKVAGRLMFIESEILTWIQDSPGLSIERFKTDENKI